MRIRSDPLVAVGSPVGPRRNRPAGSDQSSFVASPGGLRQTSRAATVYDPVARRLARVAGARAGGPAGVRHTIYDVRLVSIETSVARLAQLSPGCADHLVLDPAARGARVRLGRTQRGGWRGNDACVLEYGEREVIELAAQRSAAQCGARGNLPGRLPAVAQPGRARPHLSALEIEARNTAIRAWRARRRTVGPCGGCRRSCRTRTASRGCCNPV